MSTGRIARIWHGFTTVSNAEPYENFLITKVLPSIKKDSGKGLIGVDVFKNTKNLDNDTIEYMTILWFKDMDSIKKWFTKSNEVFTNQDYSAAHIPHEARKLLKKWDEYTKHYKNIYSSSFSKL